MSSIPLPALSVKPPEQPDVLGQYGNLLRLKGLQQGQQLQQQQGKIQAEQLQQEQIATQKAQQDQKDQTAFRAAMTDPSMKGKTIGDIADSLAQSGNISQTAWQAAKKADVDHRKDLADIDEKTLKNRKEAHDATQNLYNNAMNMPDDQLAANWSTIAQQYNAIPGNEKMPLDPNQPLPKQALAHFGPMLDMGNAYFDQELARREKIAAAKKVELENSALEQSGGMTSAQQEAKYRAVLTKASSGQKLTPEETSFAKGYEASQAKTTTTSDSLGITSSNTSRPAGLSAVGARNALINAGGNSGGTAAGKGSAASTTQNIVDLIGQYRTDPSTISRMFLKHPEILAQVQAKYPDWDQTSYQAKNKLITSYTSGPQSKEINAINTTMGHVKALDDAVDAMNNGNMTLLNKIGTAYNINVAGKTPEAAFKLIVNRVGPEIASSYIPGGGGEHERIANQNDFDVNLPPQTLHNNAAITVQLLRSKIGALENQYKNEVHRDDFEQRFITPEAQASLNKFSPHGKPSSAQGGGQSIRARDPQGKLHEAPAGTPLPAGWKLEQ